MGKDVGNEYLELTMSITSQTDSFAAHRFHWEAGLLDAIRDGVVAIDSGGIIRHVNLAANRIFGYEPGELVGESITILMPIDSREQHRSRIKNPHGIMRGSLATEGLTVEGLRKDGSSVLVHITFSEIATRGRTYYTGVVEDLSERILARKQLERQHERYEHAFSVTSDGIWDWDTKGGKFYYSNRAKEMLGLESHSNIFQVHRRILGYAMNADYPLLPPIIDNWQTEFAITLPNGSVRWILSRGKVLYSETGEAIRYVGAVTDISPQKKALNEVREMAASLSDRVRERTAELSRANAELEQASQAKDDFLANMSHELRTPLNAILGICESIAEGTYGELNECQSSALAVLEESGRHLLKLINDILDLAKIGSGKLDFDYGPVGVMDLLEGSAGFVSVQAQKKDIRLTIDAPPSDSVVYGDGRRLKQILINLLSNAVKFTPSGGTIVVGAKLSGDTLHIWVEDTGIGIPEEHLTSIFEPFRQVDGRLSRMYEGTGLGLALVSKLIQAAGGVISVKSAVGEGTRFAITLPLKGPALSDTEFAEL